MSSEFTFDEYEQKALATVSPITDEMHQRIEDSGQLLRAVVEVMIQFGSDIDKIKKHIFYGKPLDLDDLHFLPVFERLWDSGTPLSELFDAQIDLLHAAFGITGEGCELVENVLDPTRLNTPYAKGCVVEEVGDTLWYLPLALRASDVRLVDAAHANNRKLLTGAGARYKSGSFSQSEALNRDTDKEIESMQSPTKTLPGCCDE